MNNHSRAQWHPGEEKMHRLLEVPYEDNPTAPGLPMGYGLWMAESPLLALGTVDRDDHLWTTVLGGSAGVTRPIAAGMLGLSSPAHLEARTEEEGDGWTGFDPVLEALFSADGGRFPATKFEKRTHPEAGDLRIVDHGNSGRLVAGLAINLEERTRVKIAGRLLRGVVSSGEQRPDDETRVDLQMAMAVDGTLGNCPKYLNRKEVWPHEAVPHLVSDRLPLGPGAVELIGRADIFFMSTRYGNESMDTNNRGGAPGFVRISSNSEDEGVTLVYPEYSGNRVFQSLGNLTSDPAVGITFPDFETGDVLYVTGRAEILIGADAAAVLPHSKVAVRVTVEAAHFVSDGLPFRGRLLDQSPYNPPVRRLARELDGTDDAAFVDGTSASLGTATLIRGVPITPTISRYTFRLAVDPEKFTTWQAGQHVTLDFSPYLDRGWSHMCDHDPRSLNDDYIRSFTVSSTPARRPGPDRQDGVSEVEFAITVRRNGPVTGLLSRWKPGSPLTVRVLEFAGADDVRYLGTPPRSGAAEDIVVVAAGVGITPLMAQARQTLESGWGLKVLWSLKADDLPLAVDVLERVDGLAAITKLFVTSPLDQRREQDVERLIALGVRVAYRRVERDDLLAEGVDGRRRFHLCTPNAMKTSVMEWLSGEDVRSDSFDY